MKKHRVNKQKNDRQKQEQQGPTKVNGGRWAECKTNPSIFFVSQNDSKLSDSPKLIQNPQPLKFQNEPKKKRGTDDGRWEKLKKSDVSSIMVHYENSQSSYMYEAKIKQAFNQGNLTEVKELYKELINNNGLDINYSAMIYSMVFKIAFKHQDIEFFEMAFINALDKEIPNVLTKNVWEQMVYLHAERLHLLLDQEKLVDVKALYNRSRNSAVFEQVFYKSVYKRVLKLVYEKHDAEFYQIVLMGANEFEKKANQFYKKETPPLIDEEMAKKLLILYAKEGTEVDALEVDKLWQRMLEVVNQFKTKENVQGYRKFVELLADTESLNQIITTLSKKETPKIGRNGYFGVSKPSKDGLCAGTLSAALMSLKLE